MAAELRRLDRESWDGDSEDEYLNEHNGNYNVSPSAHSLVPSTARVCRTRFTALSHTGLSPLTVLLTARRGQRDGLPFTYIDSASQGHIVVHDCYVKRRLGSKLKLLGVTGAFSIADEVEISISSPSRSGIHTFRPEGPSMASTACKDNILSHTLLKKQGYQITLCEGRCDDPGLHTEVKS
eukprot:3750457-Rhodomonas_salina.2